MSMVTIIILPDGRGREVNPLGDEPKKVILGYDNQDWADWQAAEAKLRTLPVDTNRIECVLNGSDWTYDPPRIILTPGTSWKAREENGAWIIEGRAE